MCSAFAVTEPNLKPYSLGPGEAKKNQKVTKKPNHYQKKNQTKRM